MYPAGLLNERIQVLNPYDITTEYGGTDIEYRPSCTLWANVKFQKAGSILRNGNIQQQGSIFVTLRRTDKISERSRISWHGHTYRVDNLDADFHEQTFTIVASRIDE